MMGRRNNCKYLLAVMVMMVVIVIVIVIGLGQGSDWIETWMGL